MQKEKIDFLTNEKIIEWKKVKDKKILIINTQWNPEIINPMTEKSIEVLKEVGISYKVITVPGSFEIPLMAQRQASKYDGIITLGCIIKGDTHHYEAVSYAVTEGIAKVSLEKNIPISFGVQMVKNIKDAEKRASNNKLNKGYEMASALLDTLVLLDENE